VQFKYSVFLPKKTRFISTVIILTVGKIHTSNIFKHSQRVLNKLFLGLQILTINLMINH